MPKKPPKKAKPVDATPAKAAKTPETVAPRDFTAERDAEVIPAAKELLARLAVRKDLMMGSGQNVQAEKAAKYYQDIYVTDVVPLLKRHNIKVKDLKYFFSILLQPIQLLMDVTEASFHMNEDLANAKKWGVKDMADLRVMDLDRALTEEETPPVDNAGESVDTPSASS